MTLLSKDYGLLHHSIWNIKKSLHFLNVSFFNCSGKPIEVWIIAEYFKICSSCFWDGETLCTYVKLGYFVL